MGSEEYVEKVVCKLEDLQENEMRTFDLDENTKVLVILQNGQLSALGAKCTHYGAPLVQGALGEGRVRCQRHGACFNITTGDIEDFPGLDSLPCHQVSVDADNNVTVRVNKKDNVAKRVKKMTKKLAKDEEHVVVIGGGPSGAVCVETLRQEGFTGKITLICGEDCLPYDRIRVSKMFDLDVKGAQFRNDEFYQENDVEVLKGISATKILESTNQIELSNNTTLNYTSLYVATGSSARKLPLPGSDLDNVFVLRNYTDANATNAQLSPDKEVVVVGSSFIAMESAATCIGKAQKVTILSRSEYPFQPFLGPEIGAQFKQFFEEKGVDFRSNTSPKQFLAKPNTNQVNLVELHDGTTIPAHLVIMGTGSTLNTQLFKDTSAKLNPDGSVQCNQFLQCAPNIYAGGDIAHAPIYNQSKAAIGHYGLAQYHGRIAAQNILKRKVPLLTVPYFWTMLFGKGLRYAGHGSYDDIVYHGSVKEFKFAAFYLKGEEVVAACSMAMDPIISQFAEVLAQGKKILRNELPLKWLDKLHK